MFRAAAFHLATDSARFFTRKPTWFTVLPALPPVGFCTFRKTSTSGNSMTSIVARRTGLAPSVRKKRRLTSRSLTLRCRCPIETPAVLGGGSCPQAAQPVHRQAARIRRNCVFIGQTIVSGAQQIAPTAEDDCGKLRQAGGMALRVDRGGEFAHIGAVHFLLGPVGHHLGGRFQVELQAVDPVSDAEGLVAAI